MKSRIIVWSFLLLLFGSSQLYSGNVITDKIDSLLKDQLPAGTDIGVYVFDLTNDTSVYSHRKDVLFRPASVMKVITSTTALSCLGTNFNFETKLNYSGTIDADSTLHGDLYLVGGCDPAFMEHDMRSMISDLKKAGIKKINGTLFADTSMMDSVYWGSGWCWDDAPSSFQPYISPLIVHEGFIGVRVKPTSKGEAPTVEIFPSNSFIKIVNKAKTNDKSMGPLKIDRDWLNNSNTIIVSGNCTAVQSKELSVVHSEDFFFSLFREYLSKSGIQADRFGWGVCPSGANSLITVSHSLKAIMKEALKESNNLYAEAMFLQIGRLAKQKNVTFSDAAKYETNFIKKSVCTEKEVFNISDGCGLSMYDYASPNLMVEMLTYVYRNYLYYNVMYDCLPISGKDGTMRYRLVDKQTIGKVHAKTGSVTGSSTLAGYIETSDGRLLAFCIMNEGAISMAPSRKIQDAICTILCE